MNVHDLDPSTPPACPGPTAAGSGRRGAGVLVGLVAMAAAAVTACSTPAGASSPRPEAPASASVDTAAAVSTVDATLERPARLGRVDEFAFTSMASGLKKAADTVARNSNPTFGCVVVLVHAEGPSAGAMPAAAKKAVEQCGREIPLAWATRQLDVAESNGSLGKSIGECANAKVALDEVKKRFTDPRADRQRARFTDVCS